MLHTCDLENKALYKILLHSLKYPFGGCNGYLIGTVTRSSAKTTGDDASGDGQQDERIVRIRDAIPVSHTYINLPGPLEIALGMVDAQCKAGGGDEIVGYYQCNESKSSVELGAVGKKVADTVDGIAGKCSAVLVVSLDAMSLLLFCLYECVLDTHCETLLFKQLDGEKFKSIVAGKCKDNDVPLVLYTKSGSKGWSRTPGLNCPSEGLAERLAEYVQEERHMRIVDFEEHVDDISKNWLDSDVL